MRKFLIPLGLSLGGLACGLVMILVLIRLFPNLEPGGQRFIFTDLDGDTFRHQPGQVRPPAENRILEDVTRFDDADGFRRPVMRADFYPIIAIGDSFTDGGQVPWTDVLAESLDSPVRNLGWSGFGPLEYARIMQEYGGENHEWVIVAYFEGNDLSNIETSWHNAQETGGVVQLNLTRVKAAPILDIRQANEYTDIVLLENDAYLYPLTHSNPGGVPFEMAYISDYIWWLNGDLETYRDSRNIEELRGALQTIKAEAGNACVALVYVPSKEHVHFPLSDPEGNRRYVMENARELIPGHNGWLSFAPVAPQDYATLEPRLENQQTVVREVAEESGLHFIDLLPVMREAVKTGQPAYYTYDSHWNLRGHKLAGETIAAYTAQVENCGNF